MWRFVRYCECTRRQGTASILVHLTHDNVVGSYWKVETWKERPQRLVGISNLRCMQACVRAAHTSAEERAPLALRHQLHRHGLSDLRDCQSTSLVGPDDGHAYEKSASGSVGQRGHRAGHHWGKRSAQSENGTGSATWDKCMLERTNQIHWHRSCFWQFHLFYRLWHKGDFEGLKMERMHKNAHQRCRSHLEHVQTQALACT